MIVHDVVQGSPEWFELRAGKVTGSRLKRVFLADNLSLMDEIISEQLTGFWDDDDYVSDEMQWGIDKQPEALSAWEADRKLQLIRDGFIQCERFPLLGYSPDGRYGVEGGVEVKCPTSKKHVQYLRQQQLPNDHKWQVLASFIINPKLKWYDFMSYDPRLSQRPIFIHRTYREDVATELSTAETALEKFFAKLEKYKGEILFPTQFVTV